jgi:hypothetical protein
MEIAPPGSKMLDVRTGAQDPLPSHPFPLFPLPGEREQGAGSWGEGSRRAFSYGFAGQRP